MTKDSPTFTDKLKQAGTLSGASFLTPAAGAIGMAAFCGAALLAAKGNPIGDLQGMVGALGATAMTAAAVIAAGVGAVKGFMADPGEITGKLAESLKSAGRTLAIGAGGATLAGLGTLGTGTFGSMLQNADNPWVAGAAVAGLIVSSVTAVGWAFTGPIFTAYSALGMPTPPGHASRRSSEGSEGSDLPELASAESRLGEKLKARRTEPPVIAPITAHSHKMA